MSGLDEVISRLRDAIIVLDSEQCITQWLGSAERLLGYSEADVVGRNIDDLLRPMDSNGNEACLGPQGPPAMLRISKGMPEREALVVTKSGETLWIGVTAGFEHDDNGGVSSTVLVARDITRRKTVDLAKSEVISAVSHELRSPLSSVKGFTQTLLHKWDRFDDDTKKHLLTTINYDADRVTRLITELLDISRLEAGRLQLRKTSVDLVALATDVISRIQPRAEMHKLDSEFPAKFPEVFADRDKIEQVLTNLLENAVKYTEKGDVMVRGSFDDTEVKVTVADQGEGIPKEHRIQVFGKFFRRGERPGNPSGTGLGLYISKGLVEAHGGKIWVDDAAKTGAAFRFTLPLAEKSRQ
ncbi:MAG: PAS domain-containing sensor histidine kinase [Actinobacteria bacterium]|nr:PAS domain-containing sensor histidine kinase [Actinomycetota bacterium]